MSPILGIWASAQQPALNATSYESIATVTVGSGGSSSITFSSIPSTYKHLQIRCFAQTSGTAYGKLSFNSDTTNANYKAHELYGDGASASATAYAQSYGGVLINAYGGWSNSSSSAWSNTIIDILDYTSTNKNKTTRTLSGYDNNGSGSVEFQSGLWLATPAAITSITLTLSANTFSQYSSFALYGVKG